MSEQTLSLFIAAVVPGLAMAAAHWFPWHKLMGRDLSRPAAYAIGTVAIVGTGAGLLLADGQILAAATMLTCAASAGIATLGAYAIDHWSETLHKLNDWEDRNHAHKWGVKRETSRTGIMDGGNLEREGAAD